MMDVSADALNLAYSAGIIDGEGSICIGKQKQGKYVSLTVQLSVANTQPFLVYWLQQYFDCGFVVKRTPLNPRQRTVYWWIVRSQKAVKQVLPRIYPYLFLKKYQAKLCLILQTIRDSMPVPTKEEKNHRFVRQPIELQEIKQKIREKIMEANRSVM